MAVKWILSEAECTSCGHWWHAIVEHDSDGPERLFGLECADCGKLSGRVRSLRRSFGTNEQAVAYCRDILGADLTGPARVFTMGGTT